MKERKKPQPKRIKRIYVNTEEFEVFGQSVTYEQVVNFAFPGAGNATIYIVKYSRGPAGNHAGTLAAGQEVKVKNKMEFRVSATGES